MKKLLLGASAALLLTACETMTPEERAQLEADTKSVTELAQSEFTPLQDDIADICLALIEQRPAPEAVLVNNGFEAKEFSTRKTFTKSWEVGQARAGIRLRTRGESATKPGCSLDIYDGYTNKGAVENIDDLRLAWVGRLEANGYEVTEPDANNAAVQALVTELLFGAATRETELQIATKGDVTIKLSRVIQSAGQYNNAAVTEVFELIPPKD